MPTTHIDVRQIPTRERHDLIFSVFRRLGASDAMEITNDHDPWPLYAQMQALQPGRFDWKDLERGPDVFRVRIVKTHGVVAAKADVAESCCGGGCGGQGAQQ